MRSKLAFPAGREHGFDVNDGRAVDRLEVSHPDAQVFDRDNGHHVKPERIWPIRRSGGKYALHRSVSVTARMHLANVSVGEVQPRDYHDVVPGVQTGKRGPHVGIEHQPAVGRTLVALARSRGTIGESRLDPTNRTNPKAGLCHYVMLTPPSTTIVWPVT